MMPEKSGNRGTADVRPSRVKAVLQSRAMRVFAAFGVFVAGSEGLAACTIPHVQADKDSEALKDTVTPPTPLDATSAAPTSPAYTAGSTTTSAETTSAAPTTTEVPATTTSASPSSPTAAPATTTQPAPTTTQAPQLTGINLRLDQSRLGSTSFEYLYSGYDALGYADPRAGNTALNNADADPLAQPHIAYGDNPASVVIGFCFVQAETLPVKYGKEGRWAAVDDSNYVAAGGMQSSPGDIAYFSFAALNPSDTAQLPECSPTDKVHNPAGL